MMNFFATDSPERKIERLLAQGERLFQHGKEREAFEKFEEAAAILPEASKPSLAMGRAYFRRQEYDLALKHYYKGLYFCEITDEPAILCEIAQVYLSMKRYDVAEEKLLKALRLDPNFTLAIQGLAHIYFQTGRISESIAQQKILQQQYPGDQQIIQKLVDSFRLLGEYQEARNVLQNVLKLPHASGWFAAQEPLTQQLRELSFPDGTECGLKERLYARYGNICLGTLRDNGLDLHFTSSLALSMSALQITLRRFAYFVQTFSWEITCVVACEKSSSLLSALIASLLNVSVKNVSKVMKTDSVLVVQFYLKESRQFRKLLKKLSRRTQKIITFAFLAQIHGEEEEYLPDILGIPVTQETKISWKNLNDLFSPPWRDIPFLGTSVNISEAVIEQFLDELHALPVENDLQQQVTYYAETGSLLRKHLTLRTEHSSDDVLLEGSSLEELLHLLRTSRKSELYMILPRLSSESLIVEEIQVMLKTLYFARQESGMRRTIGTLLLSRQQEIGFNTLVEWFHESTEIGTKIALLNTLVLSSHRKVSDVVAEALRHPREEVRSCASCYLEKLDHAEPFTELWSMLLQDTPEIIARTIRYLYARRADILFTYLRNLFRHLDARVIHEVLTVVEQLENPEYIAEVLQLLRYDDQQIIAHAILTIGAIGDIDCGCQLLPFLEHENPDLRYAAAASLTRLERQRSIIFLMERLRKESLDVQERLLGLLGEVGLQETAPFIVQFGEQHIEHPHIVAAALQTLAVLKHRRSLPFVRKVASRFPTEANLLAYMTIVAEIGEEKDFENLITFLDHPPLIQFRVAALLYRKGFKKYFCVLQDGLRSRKLRSNLLAVSMLAEIRDEASIMEIFSAFRKNIPVLDQKIVLLLARQNTLVEYVQVFRSLPSSETGPILQGILRAVKTTESLQDVRQMLAVYSAFLGTDKLSAIYDLVSPEYSDVLQRGTMIWLAQNDPEKSRALIQQRMQDAHIDIANTAYDLWQELQGVITERQAEKPGF
ncbi:TPR repeat protein [Candidatus Vecturithrix granuli]|uniref:TPR repeat protein n=1 Tax=Vecturithrix granuli TaxID=1499967 RepID=A0A081BWL9_VECG1|nr:TPR repeat protein [Candidatus Vecturithrix granuli]